ncbi:MAG: SET domain-containing protein [Alphaproteobacteria bacterium]|nr:SET domain-containing protein [Alphaproteobacteria bacterium]
MLQVKTYISASSIHGIGLFAAEPIPKGTVIWRFDERIDRRFTRAERNELPQPTLSFITTYSYPEVVGGDVYLLDGDHARFMNHSDNPNTDCEKDTISIRDIAYGEELLCDYRQFDPDHFKKL